MGKMSYEQLRDKRNKELKKHKTDEAAVAQAEARIAQAAREAEERVRREYEAKLTELRNSTGQAISEVDAELHKEGREKNAALSQVSALQKDIEALRRDNETLHQQWKAALVELGEWKTKYLSHEPVERALSQKIKELTELFNRVEGRMKKREVEKMNALLNRQAIAGAVPGRNWR